MYCYYLFKANLAGLMQQSFGRLRNQVAESDQQDL